MTDTNGTKKERAVLCGLSAACFEAGESSTASPASAHAAAASTASRKSGFNSILSESRVSSEQFCSAARIFGAVAPVSITALARAHSAFANGSNEIFLS